MIEETNREINGNNENQNINRDNQDKKVNVNRIKWRLMNMRNTLIYFKEYEK
jgi:hypothetical protein